MPTEEALGVTDGGELHVGVGTRTGIPRRAASDLNHQVISLAPKTFLFFFKSRSSADLNCQ